MHVIWRSSRRGRSRMYHAFFTTSCFQGFNLTAAV
jgi:hypothetical protein